MDRSRLDHKDSVNGGVVKSTTAPPYQAFKSLSNEENTWLNSLPTPIRDWFIKVITCRDEYFFNYQDLLIRHHAEKVELLETRDQLRAQIKSLSKRLEALTEQPQ